ncbi:uncharacterized protein LOC123871275 isoform X2 [Maniola jurtina]|uniref:uncharacterized protein LOC123871275 isoform X2 n=1 Tax=Maniola jurtina TaxID=191418 RepID=UPI001E686A46|nr:uncharacterized protein LOC123871275 isoform X2 [Maniola jurtina]
MMPPRKVNRSPVKAAEKKPRGRQKTVKPVLKTPSVVKVKLKLPTATTVDENVENEILLFEDVEVKNPVTKNYTITKKKEVKQAITKDAPVKKKGQAKGAAKNDTTVGTSGVQEHNPACDISQIDAILKTNDDIKEVKKPVTKNNTTVKRKNVKKATTKDAPVKKKAQAKVAAKNDNVETSVIRENTPICDKSQITPNYYKVLLANDVVKWQFPNNSKYENEQRNEKFWQVVEDKKQSTSKQSKPKKPPTKERANKHNVTSKDKSDYDSTKRKQPPKNVTKTYSPEKSDCKAILTSKDESMDDADNKTMINTKNTEQSIKRKHKLSLNRKTAKAGPLKKVVDSVKKEKVVCKKGKPVKSTTKNQGIVIGKSIENCNFDECADKMEQASISSVKSWTKDISSSSNSSFITVDSNNWHYFGNKIPVVQLNDIAENLIGNRNVVVADSVIRGNQKTTNATDQQYCGSLNLNNRWFSSFSSSNSNQKEFNFCSEQNRINNYCSTEIEENVADVTRSSLRLSTSSTSSSDSSSSSSSSDGASVSETSQKNLGQTSKIHENKLSEGEMSVNSKYKMILQNLNSKIKLTQLSFKNKSNRTITKHEQERISRINDTLKQETIVHKMCQSIAQIEIDDVDKYLIRGECLQTTNIPCPKTQETHYSKDNQIINEHDNRSEECIKQHDNLQQYCPAQEADAVAADEIAEKNDSNYHLSHNKSNLNALGDNDDDDALSLFAESLTGLEPCRRNSTFNSEMSNFEEYVPQPVIHTEQQRQKIIYQPTKISNNIEAEILQCKKHEADSTSVLIDFNKPNTQENNIYEDKVGNRSQNLPTSQDIVTKNTPAANKPRLMALYHGPVPWTRSVVLKGYCFFNTMSKCKKLHCKYPHEHPNVKDVKNTLQRISENSFIQEYMLMRNSPQLRRKYGLCFVEECIRRELTRILVEIAIDFIIRTSQQSTEDNVLKSEVVDTVLMYLNQVDLSTCDDLLNFNLQNDSADLLLCDYFMSVIAMSQNFSRFKSIFIKLTDLMYRNERKFSVDVAESILERFCILPYDDLLARALLIILKNTDVTIFSNAKIGDLEKQLKASNGDLYHELESIKEQALGGQPVLDNHHERTCKPPQSLEVDKMNTNNVGHMDKNIIRYSPDTTDLGHANKPPIKIQRNITTTFNRTVNIDKLQNLGAPKTIQNKFGTQVVNNTSFKWANPSTLKIGEKAKTNLNNTTEDGRKMWQWNNRSIFDTYSNRNRNNPPMWPQKAPFKRHSNWNFDGSPKKMKRYSGPSQYQSDMS